MADTLSNQVITEDQWVSLNTLFSVAVGTAITVHNSSQKGMLISLAANQPIVGGKNWLKLPVDQIATVSAGDPEVWVYGAGDINIQVL